MAGRRRSIDGPLYLTGWRLRDGVWSRLVAPFTSGYLALGGHITVGGAEPYTIVFDPTIGPFKPIDNNFALEA